MSAAEKIAELERRLEETTKFAAEWHEQAENYKEQAEAAHDEAQDAKAALVVISHRIGVRDSQFRGSVEKRARKLAGLKFDEMSKLRAEVEMRRRETVELVAKLGRAIRENYALQEQPKSRDRGIAALRAQLRPSAWSRFMALLKGGAK